MEETSLAVRLKTIIEKLGLTDSQFADRCSISRPTLSLLLAGKNKKISDVLLSQIHQAFPDVSILWLLFGEGDIFKPTNEEQEEAQKERENEKNPRWTEKDEQLNLVSLKQIENIIQETVNKEFKASFNVMENFFKKFSEPINLRKVSMITVYYDDSTFETFIPEK